MGATLRNAGSTATRSTNGLGMASVCGIFHVRYTHLYIQNADDSGEMSTKTDDIPKRYQPGWIEQMDGRRALARDMQARHREICDDLGGADSLSYLSRSLVERFLWLEFWMAEQERALADGGEFDVGKWVQAANSAQGIAQRLGLARKAREAPSLSEYLKAKAG